MFKRKKKVAVEAVPEDEIGLLAAIAARGGTITFGAPTRCPACGDFGFVEVVAGGVQRNRCMNCGEVWQFSKRGLDLFLFAHEARDTPSKVVGSGQLVSGMSRTDWVRMTRENFVSLRSAMRDTFRGRGDK